MKKFCTILIALAICLSGCSREKDLVRKEIDSKTLVEKLADEAIPQTSISVTEKYLWDEIYINDRNIGTATIYVYKNVSDAQKYWDKIDGKYNNLQYIDKNIAVGDLKNVCDATIAEWVYFDKNVIASVQHCVTGWLTYIGDGGESYYIDGTKVSDNIEAQINKASELENKIMNCLK